MSEKNDANQLSPTDDESILNKIDYPTGFYPDQAPVHLKYVCALQGKATPDITKAFNYCELGCGPGETTAVLAACNPTGQFLGIDLNETHIEWGRTLASKSRLHNVEFLAADICELDLSSLPMFDFITMHGLYSWVPTPVQAAVRNFIAKRLKPGGVVYVSYNTLPGWGAVSGMQRFFRDLTPTDSSGPDTIKHAQDAIALLLEMEEKGAPFFKENPTAADILKRLPTHDIRYVTHEYLSPDWRPRYFVDVCGEMESAGLQYVGHGNIGDNNPDYTVTEELVPILKSAADWKTRETLGDFMTNRFFRRDVYIKPSTDDSTAAASEPSEAHLNSTLFGLTCLAHLIPEEVTIRDIGTINVGGECFDSMMKLLQTNVLTLDEIINHPLMSSAIKGDPAKLIQALSIGGVLEPFVSREITPEPGGTETIRVIPEINSVRLNNADWNESVFALASPVTGSGIILSQLETAVLRGLQRTDAIGWVHQKLNEHSIKLRPRGNDEFITDAGEERKVLEEIFEKFVKHRLPKLAYLGVVQSG